MNAESLSSHGLCNNFHILIFLKKLSLKFIFKFIQSRLTVIALLLLSSTISCLVSASNVQVLKKLA